MVKIKDSTNKILMNAQANNKLSLLNKQINGYFDKKGKHHNATNAGVIAGAIINGETWLAMNTGKPFRFDDDNNIESFSNINLVRYIPNNNNVNQLKNLQNLYREQGSTGKAFHNIFNQSFNDKWNNAETLKYVQDAFISTGKRLPKDLANATGLSTNYTYQLFNGGIKEFNSMLKKIIDNQPVYLEDKAPTKKTSTQTKLRNAWNSKVYIDKENSGKVYPTRNKAYYIAVDKNNNQLGKRSFNVLPTYIYKYKEILDKLGYVDSSELSEEERELIANNSAQETINGLPVVVVDNEEKTHKFKTKKEMLEGYRNEIAELRKQIIQGENLDDAQKKHNLSVYGKIDKIHAVIGGTLSVNKSKHNRFLNKISKVPMDNKLIRQYIDLGVSDIVVNDKRIIKNDDNTIKETKHIKWTEDGKNSLLDTIFDHRFKSVLYLIKQLGNMTNKQYKESLAMAQENYKFRDSKHYNDLNKNKNQTQQKLVSTVAGNRSKTEKNNFTEEENQKYDYWGSLLKNSQGGYSWLNSTDATNIYRIVERNKELRKILGEKGMNRFSKAYEIEPEEEN